MSNIKLKHNKKRNIGLISEFFSRYMAAAVVERKPENMDKARRIWDKFFAPGTALRKELDLFSALHETDLKDRNIAFRLVERVQGECKKQSQAQLDKEKLALVLEVNTTLKDPQFFERTVPNYKSFASVQLLMNAWRGTGFKGQLSELAGLEEDVVEHILTEKVDKEHLAEKLLVMNEVEIDGLVLNLVQEKVNQKFDEIFNKEQRAIVDTYVFSKGKGLSPVAQQKLSTMFENIKKTTLALMVKEHNNFDAGLRTKLTEVKNMLGSPEYGDTSKINDDTVGFYLSVAKLREELASKGEIK